MKLEFYVGQAVTVLDGCEDIYDERGDYTWADSMSAFVGHSYIIKNIEDQGDRTLIYLNPMFEEDDVVLDDGYRVGDYYFCEWWLAPLQIEMDESTELESFFSDI